MIILSPPIHLEEPYPKSILLFPHFQEPHPHRQMPTGKLPHYLFQSSSACAQSSPDVACICMRITLQRRKSAETSPQMAIYLPYLTLLFEGLTPTGGLVLACGLPLPYFTFEHDESRSGNGRYTHPWMINKTSKVHVPVSPKVACGELEIACLLICLLSPGIHTCIHTYVRTRRLVLYRDRVYGTVPV